jgi:hypothetical protein
VQFKRDRLSSLDRPQGEIVAILVTPDDRNDDFGSSQRDDNLNVRAARPSLRR